MNGTTATAEPTLYVIWYRAPGKGQRWKKAGRTTTYAEALTLIGGAGDWHIAPLRDKRLAGDAAPAAKEQPGLFDE